MAVIKLKEKMARLDSARTKLFPDLGAFWQSNSMRSQTSKRRSFAGENCFVYTHNILMIVHHSYILHFAFYYSPFLIYYMLLMPGIRTPCLLELISVRIYGSS